MDFLRSIFIEDFDTPDAFEKMPATYVEFYKSMLDAYNADIVANQDYFMGIVGAYADKFHDKRIIEARMESDFESLPAEKNVLLSCIRGEDMTEYLRILFFERCVTYVDSGEK